MTGRLGWLFVLLAIAGAALVLVATARYGAGASPDSGAYVSAARSFAAGEGLRLFDGTPLLRWPPLYPWLLGIIERVSGLHPLRSAALVNALLFGAIIVAGGALLTRHLAAARGAVLAGAALLLCSIPLYRVSVMAWSEPLFILLALLFLLGLETQVRRGDLRSLSLLAALAGLACLTRYVGVTLIVTGVAAILLLGEAPLRRRIGHATLLAVVATTPLALWIARNLALSGTPTGPRRESESTLLHGAVHTFKGFLSWFLPESVTGQPLVVAGLAVVLVGLAVVSRRRLGRSLAGSWPAAGPLVLFVAIYLASLIASSTLTAYDRIDWRLLSPVYVPLVVLGLLVLTGVAGSGCDRPRRPVDGLLAGGLLLCLWHPFVEVTRGSLRRAGEGAGGFNTRFFREHEIVRFLRERPFPAGQPVYSNAPEALYIATGLPAKLSPRPPRRGRGVASAATAWPETSPGYLVWFAAGGRAVHPVEDLARMARVEALARFPGGAVYTVSRAPGSERSAPGR